MGILYLIFSLLIVSITSICIIGYVVKTRKYNFLWIIVALIVLLYSANEFYNYYRTCQIPRITPLSFRQVNADEIHSIIPYNKIIQYMYWNLIQIKNWRIFLVLPK